MSAWIIASGFFALIAATGHAFAGRKMFYLPMHESLRNDTHKAVLTGMWHLITVHFASSAGYLICVGLSGHIAPLDWIVVLQFGAYATIFFTLSVTKLGSPLRLFQWIIFLLVPIFYGASYL